MIELLLWLVIIVLLITIIYSAIRKLREKPQSESLEYTEGDHVVTKTREIRERLSRVKRNRPTGIRVHIEEKKRI